MKKLSFLLWLVLLTGCATRNTPAYLSSLTYLVEADGYGTAVAIDATHLLTCAHVVEGSAEVRVRCEGGEWQAAKVVAYSKQEDLAVLEVAPGYLSRYVNWSGLPVRQGQRLLHVGCFHGPGGVNSYAEGIVSHTDRTLGGKSFCQMTCPAYPGSSGGGVYDASGRLVGVVARLEVVECRGVEMYSSTWGYFIPADRARAWLEREGF